MSEWPKETTYKDVPALEYENGLILNAETKKIMRPVDKTLFTTEKAVEANETKKERAIQAAMEALAEGESAQDIVEGAFQGWKTLTAAMKRLAQTGDNHAAVSAFREVGKATGMLSQGRSEIEAQDASGNRVRLSGEFAEIVEQIRNFRQSGA